MPTVLVAGQEGGSAIAVYAGDVSWTTFTGGGPSFARRESPAYGRGHSDADRFRSGMP